MLGVSGVCACVARRMCVQSIGAGLVVTNHVVSHGHTICRWVPQGFGAFVQADGDSNGD